MFRVQTRVTCSQEKPAVSHGWVWVFGEKHHQQPCADRSDCEIRPTLHTGLDKKTPEALSNLNYYITQVQGKGYLDTMYSGDIS